MSDRRRSRCAIYTRKSFDEGLEQDFNSLDAQREACEAYIASQRSEGWTLLSDRYDDGGWSGGTLERPALQTLLGDIEAGKIDIVVVYKIDRLTRSLMDFAKLVEVLDRKTVTFVSVTQAFNTTTSMGRLTLNVLLSFAQFEREVTSERIRDKIAASKKKGMWMGGWVPIGYKAKDRTLSIVESDAEIVRTIFRLYLKLGNVRLAEVELRRRGLTTRRSVSASGRAWGGRPFARGHIYRILSNPLYIGEVEHRGICHPGQHPAIIDRVIWDAAQAQLKANSQGTRTRKNSKEPSLLSGLLFDDIGRRMVADHAIKGGRRYRYYATAGEADSEARGSFRIPVPGIEPVVIHLVCEFLGRTGDLIDALKAAKLEPESLRRCHGAAQLLATELKCGTATTQREILLDVVEQIAVGTTSVRIQLKRQAIAARLLDDDQPTADRATPIMIEAPVRVARRGAETKMVIEGEAALNEPDPALLKAVARAHVWFDELVSGRAKSIAEIAEREGLSPRYVARLLNLAFLPPELVGEIVAGRQPADLTAETLSHLGRRDLLSSTSVTQPREGRGWSDERARR